MLDRTGGYMAKPIQEILGERVITMVADFSRSELKDPDQLAADEFAHVSDLQLRKALAQVFYGARWIYKLGLTLYVRDVERAAHVRAQIVDYASVCEALLSYCVKHAIASKHTTGDSHLWKDPDKRTRPLDWTRAAPDAVLKKQTLWWLVVVARDLGIIKPALAKQLDRLREERNAVHIKQRVALGGPAYLAESKQAFALVGETVRQTKLWKAAHA